MKRSYSQIIQFPALLLVLVLVLALLSQAAVAVGFQKLTIADPQDKPLAVGIWYPSDAAVPQQWNTPFRQALAIDGKVAGSDLPLIVMSHGYGSWMGAHANIAKALAAAGYIVAAPTHTGNNYRDESYPASRWLIDRPRHLSLVIDYLLEQWPDRAVVNQSRIGGFGFSAGGYTVMTLAGAELELGKLGEYCDKYSYELVCEVEIAKQLRQQGMDNAVSQDWGKDERIKAVIAVAPAIGFAFSDTSLARIKLPVQLWSGTEDSNVPYALHVKPIEQRLGAEPEMHLVKDAGHFSFMPSCDPKLASLEELWDRICVDKEGFDRAEFQQQLIEQVLKFFNERLAQ